MEIFQEESLTLFRVLPVQLPQPPQEIDTGSLAQDPGSLFEPHQVFDQRGVVKTENDSVAVVIVQK